MYLCFMNVNQEKCRPLVSEDLNVVSGGVGFIRIVENAIKFSKPMYQGFTFFCPYQKVSHCGAFFVLSL